MKCASCGAELEPGDQSCGECGHLVPAVEPPPPPATCANCGASLGPGDEFCGECGQPVSAPVKPPVSLPRRPRIPGWAWAAGGSGIVILAAALVAVNAFQGIRSPIALPTLTQPAPTALTQAPSPTPSPPTPTETPSPWPTGDLWWTRQVYVYDAVAPPPAPKAGAQVQASAISSDSCTTDSNGYCSITVHAYDTGWVDVSVIASGYQPFNDSYAGLPSYGELDIGLQPLSSPTVTPTPTCPPPATPEPLWVDPVMSPTFALTQTVTVCLGRGRTVTVTSEAGTTVVNGFFDAHTNPAYVTINLLPDTTHHLEVAGLVEYAPDCFYTLRTTLDRNGNPLIIVQQSPTPTVTPTVTSTATHTPRPPTDTPSPTLRPGLVIQGYVRLNVAGGPGLANVKIYRGFASYPGDLVAITDQDGYYETEFVSIPGDETVTVWAELAGYSFSPAQHSWRHYYGYELVRLDFVANAHTPTATVSPTYTPTSAPARVPGWTAIGGQWTWLEPGLLYGETDSLDGLFLYEKYYEDFTFSADVQALDREASLAFRMQDSANGYLVIFVPQGASGANPGLWLAKRVDGAHSFLAHYGAGNLPFVEDWVSLSVQVSGSRFRVYLNGTLAIDFTDTSAPAFTSGRLGFRIYGDTSAPCHAYFRNIQLP